MKTILIGLIVSLCGCSMIWKNPNSPEQLSQIKNYRRCSSDLDCYEGERCGFVGIDTFAVCR
jgi:hypothetical protein